MITPPYLKKGDLLGIVSPAGKVNKEIIDNAVKVLEERGYPVKVSSGALDTEGYFAGSDARRAAHFQDMLMDPQIRAIFCARGGYGTVRILDRIPSKLFKKQPKWIIGFSDITALHLKLNQKVKMESIHGIMPSFFRPAGEKDTSLDTLLSLLEGNISGYERPTHPLSVYGNARGILTGGNLSVLMSLRGTAYDIETKNKILLIEEIDEYLYHFDRMLFNLYLGKKFNAVKGIIIGHLTGMKDTSQHFGKSGWEIVRQFTDSARIPVIFNFPSGHDVENLPLIMGREITLEISEQATKISW